MKLNNSHQNVPLLTLFGLIIGALVATVMWMFEKIIHLGSQYLASLGGTEAQYIWLLPFVSMLLYYGLIKLLSAKNNHIGISHVLHQFAYQRSQFPFKNVVLQFLGAPLAIFGQFSAGKEGPVVHIGAALASIASEKFNFNHGSREILTSCGAAAAISAVFGTPLAGVIFAIEVIFRRFQHNIMLPLMAASVTSFFVASQLHIEFFNFDQITPFEFSINLAFWLTITALLTGISAAAFNYSSLAIRQYWQGHLLLKLLTAAAFTSLILLISTEVSGGGYHLINQLLNLDIHVPIALIMTLFLAKMAATTIMVGFSVPGGLIAPILVCGGLLGALVAESTGLHALLPIFVLVGATAMMGASLNAPLAALAAILELNGNLMVVWPAMFAIVIANLICHQVFLQPGIFVGLSGIGRTRRIQMADLPINEMVILYNWQQKNDILKIEESDTTLKYFIRLDDQLAVQLTLAELVQFNDKATLLRSAKRHPLFLIQRKTALILDTVHLLERRNLHGVLVSSLDNQYHSYRLTDLAQ